MNGMSLDKLIKNDKKLDPDLVSEFRKITMISEEEKTKNYSNDKMEEKEFCDYLKTKITRKKMKKLFEVLLLKHRYSDKKDMTELCHELRIHRPDLMRPRVLNLILRIINVVFNKTAIIIFLITIGITFGLISNNFYGIKDKISEFTKKVNIDLNQFLEEFLNSINMKIGELQNTLDEKTNGMDLMDFESLKHFQETKEIEQLNSFKEFASNLIQNIPKESLIGLLSILSGAANMTLYNILRQASYYMPRGFRLGNRVRARHSARKIIGENRDNKVILAVLN